jgi:Putative Flp pilus-assembly TadE/G-like
MFMTLLFAVGLAVDAGQLFVAKRTEQEAADAASFAGAIVIYQGGQTPPLSATITAAVSAAVADATRNGYTNGVDNTTVVVNSPPSSGAFSGNVNHVEVIITHQVPTSLVPAESLLNPVRARSVAGAEALNNGYAIMALNRGNTPGAFTDSPNADIHLVGGGILVNSTSPTAAGNSQNGCNRFTIGSGSVDVNGGTSSTWPSGCTPAFPSVNTGVVQQPDPFAGFPRPSTAGLPTCNALAACQDFAGNQKPGIYTVSLGGAGGTTLTLNSGVYILEHGINEAGNADIQSNAGGVFIFNTTTNYPSPGGTCSSMTLAGNAVSTLAPMTTGTYANFLVYQDPACAAGMTISGNGTFTGTGTIYLPSASFRFNGNNATLTGSQLVANTVDIQNGNLTIDYTGGNTAQPILPRIAE